jgi:hypothetical protein
MKDLMVFISKENNKMFVKTSIPPNILCDGEMVFGFQDKLVYLYKPEKIAEDLYLCSEDITKHQCSIFGFFGKMLEGVKHHYEILDNFSRTYHDFLAGDY